CRDAAHLDLQMRFGHATILARRLHGRGRLRALAERLDRDARNRPDMRLAGHLVCRSGPGLSALEGKRDHWPTSLILPLLASGTIVAVLSPLRNLSRTVDLRAARIGVSPRGCARSGG